MPAHTGEKLGGAEQQNLPLAVIVAGKQGALEMELGGGKII